MLERFRGFLDRPLEPSAGRAILALAAAILLGLALLFVLADRAGHRADPSAGVAAHAALAPAQAPSSGRRSATGQASRERSVPHQDPQDRRGTVAERASGELRTHRALQHVPYRRGQLRIELAGARGGKALLRVSAPTVAAARRGWRAFLHRYRDDGHSYIPLFDATARPRGGGA